MIFPLPLFKRVTDLSFLYSLPSLISETPSTDLVSGNVKPSCHRAAKKNYPHPGCQNILEYARQSMPIELSTLIQDTFLSSRHSFEHFFAHLVAARLVRDKTLVFFDYVFRHSVGFVHQTSCNVGSQETGCF